MNTSNEFITVFNEYYPFERYIFKSPQAINYLFDKVVLTEIFIPYTEIKARINEKGYFYGYTEVPVDEIYVKIKGSSEEISLAFFDFSEHIREQIVYNLIGDFGQYEYESLYVDHEDGNDELKSVLMEQFNLIKEKYGECKVKKAVRDNLIETE